MGKLAHAGERSDKGEVGGLTIGRPFRRRLALPVVAAALAVAGEADEVEGPAFFNEEEIRRLASNDAGRTTLDRIMTMKDARLCVVAPYFDPDFEEAPHSPLFRVMQEPFDSDSVIRVAIFDQDGRLMAENSVSRRFLDTAPGFRAKCGRASEFLVQIGPAAAFADITILE